MTLTSEQMSVAIVFTGLSTILSTIASVAAVVKSVRREPPIDRTLQEYATKNELSCLRVELQQRCALQHQQIDTNLNKLFDLNRDSEQRLAEWQRGLANQLGRIESSVGDLKDERKNRNEHPHGGFGVPG